MDNSIKEDLSRTYFLNTKYFQPTEEFIKELPKKINSDVETLPECTRLDSVERYLKIYQKAYLNFSGSINKTNPLYVERLNELVDIYGEEIIYPTKRKVEYLEKLVEKIKNPPKEAKSDIDKLHNRYEAFLMNTKVYFKNISRMKEFSRDLRERKTNDVAYRAREELKEIARSGNPNFEKIISSYKKDFDILLKLEDQISNTHNLNHKDVAPTYKFYLDTIQPLFYFYNKLYDFHHSNESKESSKSNLASNTREGDLSLRISYLRELWMSNSKIEIDEFIKKGNEKGIWNENLNLITKRNGLYGTGKTTLGCLFIALKGWAIHEHVDYKQAGKQFCLAFEIPVNEEVKQPYKAFSTGNPTTIRTIKIAFNIKS